MILAILCVHLWVTKPPFWTIRGHTNRSPQNGIRDARVGVDRGEICNSFGRWWAPVSILSALLTTPGLLQGRQPRFRCVQFVQGVLSRRRPPQTLRQQSDCLPRHQGQRRRRRARASPPPIPRSQENSMRINIPDSIPLSVGQRWKAILKPVPRPPKPRSGVHRVIADGLKHQAYKRWKSTVDARERENAARKQRAEQAEQERKDS